MEEARIQEIRDWIKTDVICFNPIAHVMGKYAQNLVREGYHSIEMIKRYLVESGDLDLSERPEQPV